MPPSLKQSRKQFNVPSSLLAHFFHTWSQAGLFRLTFQVGHIQEQFLPALGSFFLESPSSRVISHLDNGLQLVEHSGSLRALFGPASRMHLFELDLGSFEHFVSTKNQCLFTLPLSFGLDQTVLHFLEMQSLVNMGFCQLEMTQKMTTASMAPPRMNQMMLGMVSNCMPLVSPAPGFAGSTALPNPPTQLPTIRPKTNNSKHSFEAPPKKSAHKENNPNGNNSNESKSSMPQLKFEEYQIPTST